MVEKLKSIVPGETTAADVEALLLDSSAIEGSTPGPLWNDLLAYDPRLTNSLAQAGNQVAVDNELLRSAREHRDDRYLLLWVALNLAEPRLDAIVREVLTDEEGHLRPDAVNASHLRGAIDQRHAADDRLPHGSKATSNILSLLERCRLIVPQKHSGSIVGIKQALPTRHAVPGTVSLVAQRLADHGLEAAPGREVDLALSIGANAWLNLSAEEFRAAYQNVPNAQQQTQSARDQLPADLIELASQLRRKGQVVLQGPPGAGKTYVAKRYVRWVTAGRPEESRLQGIIDDLPANERTVQGIAGEVVRRGLAGLWDIVQFHPGYDYTDFVRALVAQPHGEGVTFVPQHRILSLICAVGIELTKLGYDLELVLVLDEINRGDIPNIFGELLYALEYRGEAVATPYAVAGEASLTIPKNLRILGTMNTADRSIAVIDYALRRRFVFLETSATDEPIQTFSFDDEQTRAAARFLHAATADALTDAPPGLQVGPSYFLAEPDGADGSLAILADRYVYEVLPLLTEYELEGEVQPGALVGLRQSLGLSDGSPQRTHAQELAAYLAAEPWKGSSGAAAGPMTTETTIDSTTEQAPEDGQAADDPEAP